MRTASLGYAAAVQLRNRQYSRHPERIRRCGVPVISVGNLTTGGTGKTPVVRHLARWFRRHHVRVAIVSRGYGRDETGLNDEAMELHAALPDVPQVQDPDRVEAARIAVEELEAELILMDDGFQHRRLHRDLDVVVIDATCPFGFGYLLPRGLLREPRTELRRADLVLLSRTDAVDPEQLAELRAEIAAIAPELPCVSTVHAPTGWLEHPDRIAPVETLRGKRVAVVAAIGNPDAFLRTVAMCGAEVVDSRTLPDHDRYERETVSRLSDWIGGLGDRIDGVVCTHKDLVKLRTDRLAGKTLRALQVELRVTAGEEQLEQALQSLRKCIA